MEPVTARFPTVPVSVNVKRVFGEPSASFIVKTALVPAVASVMTGALSESVSGEAFDNVTTPEASIVVAPAIAPVLVMPPVLLLMPPVTSRPPALIARPPVVIVCPAVKVFDWFLYATFVRVFAVFIFAPFS